MGKKKKKFTGKDEPVKGKKDLSPDTADRKGKFNKRNSRGKSCDSEGRDLDRTTTNDPKWYLNNPTLTRDVGSLWFSTPAGNVLSGPKPLNSVLQDTTNEFVFGSMVQIRTLCNWGWTTGRPTDQLNQIATNLYQYVVHANSRNTSYQKSDLLKMCMTIDSVWQMIAWAIRAYRLRITYSPMNDYYTNILTLCGWDPNSVRINPADFRYYINDAINRINMFMCPNLFDIARGHIAEYSHVYADADDVKANLYAAVPWGYWEYNDEKGQLQCIEITQPMTPDQWLSIINNQITAIQNSEYMGIMQGDCLKAFGLEGMAKFTYVGIDEILYPEFDTEFLFKFHNAEFLCQDLTMTSDKTFNPAIPANSDGNFIPSYADSADVSGNIMGGIFNFSEDFEITHFVLQDNQHIYDMLPGMPVTPETVSLATAWKISNFQTNVGKQYPNAPNTNTYYTMNCGYSLMMSATLMFNQTDSKGDVNITAELTAGNTYVDVADYVSLVEQCIIQFSSYPIFYPIYKTTTETTPTYTMGFMKWNINNVQLINDETVSQILDVMLWSLFASSVIMTGSRG